MTSYNVHDAEHHYCGNCHHFCDDQPVDPERHWTVRVSGQARGVGILVTDDVDEVVRDVERWVKAGVETIHVYRWPAVPK